MGGVAPRYRPERTRPASELPRPPKGRGGSSSRFSLGEKPPTFEQVAASGQFDPAVPRFIDGTDADGELVAVPVPDPSQVQMVNVRGHGVLLVPEDLDRRPTTGTWTPSPWLQSDSGPRLWPIGVFWLTCYLAFMASAIWLCEPFDAWWFMTPISWALIVALVVGTNRRRARARWRAMMVTRAEESLRVAQTEGLAALLEHTYEETP